MTDSIIVAVADQNGVVIREASLLSQRDSVLAAYLTGRCGLELLRRLSTTTLIYAEPSVIFDFACEDRLLNENGPAITWLCDRVGAANALELLLGFEEIDGAKALRVGVVNGICMRAEFDEIVKRIGKLSVSAIGLALELAQRGVRLSKEQAELIERYAFALRFSHPDQREGMRAFLEKRTPKFTG